MICGCKKACHQGVREHEGIRNSLQMATCRQSKCTSRTDGAYHKENALEDSKQGACCEGSLQLVA